MRKSFPAVLILLALGLACSCANSGELLPDEDIRFERMRSLVKNISVYARSIKGDFIIIPQNGIELAFNNAEIDEGVTDSYLRAIDGIGLEALFYNGSLRAEDERLGMARALKGRVKILAADYVSDDANLPDSAQKSKNEGFIAFPRSSGNYDYKDIPETVIDENSNDIASLADAKNCLYLISSDNFSNKSEMIEAVAVTNYDLVLIDLFSFDDAFTKPEIERLKKKANGKKRLLISYISVGSAENYRYYWRTEWKKGNPSWLKKNYEGYPDEFWVEFWNPEWQSIIYGNDNSYIKKIIDSGFDGAYLDNVEAYYFLDIHDH